MLAYRIKETSNFKIKYFDYRTKIGVRNQNRFWSYPNLVLGRTVLDTGWKLGRSRELHEANGYFHLKMAPSALTLTIYWFPGLIRMPKMLPLCPLPLHPRGTAAHSRCLWTCLAGSQCGGPPPPSCGLPSSTGAMLEGVGRRCLCRALRSGSPASGSSKLPVPLLSVPQPTDPTALLSSAWPWPKIPLNPAPPPLRVVLGRVMLSPCHPARPSAASPCHPAWAHRQAASCPLPGAPLHLPQSCPGDPEVSATFPEAAHSLVIWMPAKLVSSGGMRKTPGACGLPWTLTR